MRKRNMQVGLFIGYNKYNYIVILVIKTINQTNKIIAMTLIGRHLRFYMLEHVSICSQAVNSLLYHHQ